MQYLRKRSFIAAQWLLVLLALTQTAFAAHQFEHTVADLGQVCAVCVHLDRLDDACPPDIPSVEASVPVAYAVPIEAATSGCDSASPYQSRASP
jgi:hypothetical protein